MSPEQVNAQELDGRSDLFATGALLHEMLTGLPLFHADNDMQLLQRLLNSHIEPPSTRNANVSPELDRVVLQALERDRNARFPTGRDMARAIEQAVGLDELFDEAAVAGLMRELFHEHIERTQQLFDQHIAERDESLRDAAVKLDEPLPVIDDAATGPSTTRTAPALPPASSPGTGTTETVKGAWVLAVDDSVIAREMIRALLENEGFRVIAAPSAAAAIELLEQQRPDLVLLDVMMPEMDGFELCRRIRESTPGRQLPILFISSACSLEERLRGLTVGGDDFIRKPYEPEELTGRVRAHLQRVAFLNQLSPT
jgi:CheY-like chemotaxis protein